MKFFNIDCHISVIEDIKNIFNQLGHEVISWSLSGHRWVFNLPKCPSNILTEENWQNLDEQIIENFIKENKNFLDQFDGFICTHHIHFLKLFEKFKKPIIVVASTRYEYPFVNNKNKLTWLEDSLNNNENLILVANNEFDKKYCEKFTTRIWDHIPSLCLYTEEKHNPLYQESILFCKIPIQLSSNKIIHQSSLKKYTWKQLYSYKNIIHLPYNISTMSIFEQHSAGVPLYFPSLEFSLDLINQGIPLFSEIVFPNNFLERQAEKFLNKQWLKLADFYNGTIKVNYFNSIKELLYIINFPEKEKPISNKELVFSKWKKIINKLK